MSATGNELTKYRDMILKDVRDQYPIIPSPFTDEIRYIKSRGLNELVAKLEDMSDIDKLSIWSNHGVSLIMDSRSYSILHGGAPKGHHLKVHKGWTGVLQEDKSI